MRNESLFPRKKCPVRLFNCLVLLQLFSLSTIPSLWVEAVLGTHDPALGLRTARGCVVKTPRGSKHREMQWQWSKETGPVGLPRCPHFRRDMKCPDSCPLVLKEHQSLAFDPHRFVDMLANRTLVFFGDSMSRQFFESTACVLYAKLSKHFSSPKTFIPSRISHTRIFFNKCLRIHGTCRICMYTPNGIPFARKGSQFDMVLPFLSRNDIVVLNFGLWYNKGDSDDINGHHSSTATGYGANAITLERHCKRMASIIMASGPNLPTFIWRETSAQHFPFDDTGTYRFGSKKTANSCSDWIISSSEQNFHKANWRNEVCNPIMENAGIPVMRIFNFTALSPASGHIGTSGTFGNWKSSTGVDCTHFCSPGIIDAFVPQLDQLLRRVLGRPNS
mmetsp:Transcript_33389/g.72861  ORF Transcript_33389/g.72861 Transcript_33389/m.72861 type:complete len:390 (-) Transcript_33389:1733-2902(-)